MSPRPSVREERTQQIIEAALKVFSEQGFNNATMDEIAEEAGLSKGALYWYFKGKDKIISNLMQWFFEREYSMMAKWLESDEPPRVILEKTAQMVIDDLVSVRAFVPILFEFISLSFRNSAVGEVVRENMYGFFERLEPVFQAGIDNGVFEDKDARNMALAYGALIEGSIMIWSYDPKGLDFESMTLSSIKIFLDGITKTA